MNVLDGLGTIFGFVSAIALIVSHDFRFPKWPFTADRWSPKPSEVKEKEDKDAKEKEITEEQLIEDELAEAVGRLNRRSLEVDRDIEALGGSLTKRHGASKVKIVC